MLVILGLLLRGWQPPIKSQYIVILLLTAGSGLGYYLIQNWMWGFCIAGLTFYKDTLVEDFRLVANSYKGLTDINLTKEMIQND